jgi:hypothetical protein
MALHRCSLAERLSVSVTKFNIQEVERKELGVEMGFALKNP